MNASQKTYKVTFTSPLFPKQTGEMVITVEDDGRGNCSLTAEGFGKSSNYSTCSYEFAIRHWLRFNGAEPVTIIDVTPPQTGEVDVTRVVKVYSGKPGCACGCRGKYTHSKAHAAGRTLGNEIEAGQVSDRTVKLIVNKINRMIAAGEGTVMRDAEFVSVYTDTRSYCAYFV